MQEFFDDKNHYHLRVFMACFRVTFQGYVPVFLGVGKKFRLLMQACRFFLLLFHENFKLLRNCPYYFHKILHSHSTPKGAPTCAKAAKSYDWNVRNIAKISPKMAKIIPKTAIFRLFYFSQKLLIRFKRNFLQ